MKIRTDFNFILPRGREEDPDGRTAGGMKLVKVKDLLLTFRDSRVKATPAYFYVVLLTRVITRLGKDKIVSARTIENLHPEDFTFLVDFFNEINHKVISMLPIECTHCGNKYVGEVSLAGEL